MRDTALQMTLMDRLVNPTSVFASIAAFGLSLLVFFG